MTTSILFVITGFLLSLITLSIIVLCVFLNVLHEEEEEESDKLLFNDEIQQKNRESAVLNQHLF
jgi:uncharacterized membrane protein